ncbi:MAG: class I SAM-dependent methyltransferase [Hyphomicrobiales bacterium]|nr:class I SAM-dependent methyltransferase [Hyphomicrobiales bacterium]MBV8442406.1 class I SAM-dependent methyltransferase [Hyphomicrobiales bacterium]
MEAGHPSRTAQSVAIHRAEHQLYDVPRVLHDPLALWIIGPEGAASIALGCWAAGLPGPRAMRAFVVARSRYAEDELARAVASGTAQYVILGAGLDTFAYRNPYAASGLSVFEVDHPATQAWKLSRLALMGIPVPRCVAFVPADFERQELEAGLMRAGFRRKQPAFFSWLGVTQYISREAVMATFAQIRRLCPASGVAFDYALPRDALPEAEKLTFDALNAEFERDGEPFLSFFRPERLAKDLKAIGFRGLEHPTTDELNDRYFRDRPDGLKLAGPLGGLMCAT